MGAYNVNFRKCKYRFVSNPGCVCAYLLAETITRESCLCNAIRILAINCISNKSGDDFISTMTIDDHVCIMHFIQQSHNQLKYSRILN